MSLNQKEPAAHSAAGSFVFVLQLVRYFSFSGGLSLSQGGFSGGLSLTPVVGFFSFLPQPTVPDNTVLARNAANTRAISFFMMVHP